MMFQGDMKAAEHLRLLTVKVDVVTEMTRIQWKTYSSKKSGQQSIIRV